VRLFLALRSIFFVFLLPGTVAGYVPYRILRGEDALVPPALVLANLAPALLVAVGAAVLFASVWEFFARGRGTLAPVDPPKELVVSGLYRYTRNPMYNGVLAILLGLAWLFRSAGVLEYAAGTFVAFTLFVLLYEEPALARRFGDSYAAYRRAVPRWGFTRRPYPGVH
jgi:protein-S-isoprenylcysteine O-methyltransferase Ste14